MHAQPLTLLPTRLSALQNIDAPRTLVMGQSIHASGCCLGGGGGGGECWFCCCSSPAAAAATAAAAAAAEAASGLAALLRPKFACAAASPDARLTRCSPAAASAAACATGSDAAPAALLLGWTRSGSPGVGAGTGAVAVAAAALAAALLRARFWAALLGAGAAVCPSSVACSGHSHSKAHHADVDSIKYRQARRCAGRQP